jgi:hypothetical protein
MTVTSASFFRKDLHLLLSSSSCTISFLELSSNKLPACCFFQLIRVWGIKPKYARGLDYYEFAKEIISPLFA